MCFMLAPKILILIFIGYYCFALIEIFSELIDGYHGRDEEFKRCIAMRNSNDERPSFHSFPSLCLFLVTYESPKYTNSKMWTNLKIITTPLYWIALHFLFNRTRKFVHKCEWDSKFTKSNWLVYFLVILVVNFIIEWFASLISIRMSDSDSKSTTSGDYIASTAVTHLNREYPIITHILTIVFLIRIRNEMNGGLYRGPIANSEPQITIVQHVVQPVVQPMVQINQFSTY